MGNANEVIRSIDMLIPSPDISEDDSTNREHFLNNETILLSPILISKHLKMIAQLLAQEDCIRIAFVHFLYSRRWLNQFLLFSISKRDKSSDGNSHNNAEVFRHFDYYTLPTGAPMAIVDPPSDDTSKKPQVFAIESEGLPTFASNSIGSKSSSAGTTPTHFNIAAYKAHNNQQNQKTSSKKTKSVPLDPRFGSTASRSPDMIFLLIAGVLPLFLHSQEFQRCFLQLQNEVKSISLVVPIDEQERLAQKEFLKGLENIAPVLAENNKSPRPKQQPLSVNKVEATVGPIPSSYSLKDLSESRKTRFAHFVELNLNRMSQETISRCLGRSLGGWFQDLPPLLETLPYPLTIANADPTHPGFPLIYGNKSFENMTKYTRSEFLGRNCNFLQSKSHTESHQVEKIINALREKVPIKLGITNRRKNKDVFVNLLSLLPVIDRVGNYVYVISIAYDLTMALHGEQTIEKQQKVNQDLINIDNLLIMIHNVLCQ